MMHSTRLLAALFIWLVQTSLAQVTVTTFAGTGTPGHNDGPRLTATFIQPTDIGMDASNNLLITNLNHSYARIVRPNGVVSTFFENAIRRAYPNDRSNSWFRFIGKLAFDAAGTLYISDGERHRICMVVNNQTVLTFAGTGVRGYADGPVSSAQFDSPKGIAFDSSGNMFVADWGNHCIRKITPGGIVSTFAGIDNQSNSTQLGPISGFSHPHGIAIDAHNNLFVSDTNYHRIRMITPDGTVLTIAGGNSRGFRDGPAHLAKFNAPKSMTIDSIGSLYVADSNNNRIRKISFTRQDDRRGRNGLMAPDHGVHDGHNDSTSDEYFSARDDVGFDGVQHGVDLEDVQNDELESAFEHRVVVPPRPINYGVDECAICYEVKAEGDEFDYCSMSCGNTFHKRCIDRCMTRRSQKKCPMCRSRWIMNKPQVAITNTSPDAES